MIKNRTVLNGIFLFFFCFVCPALANTDFHLNFEEGDLPSLHPHILQGHARGRVLALLLYEGLMGVDAEGNAFLKNAKKVTTSDDGLLYIFELHERQWSNGVPLTAYDYERSWKLAADPHAVSDYSDLLYIIKNAKEAKKGMLPIDLIGVKALDNFTLQVELEYPAPYFLKLLAQPLFLPLPKGELNYSNGPFTVFHHQKDVSLLLKRNVNFWKKSAIFLSQISISFIADSGCIMEKYRQGELDFIGEPISRLSNEALLFYQTRGEIQQANPSRFFWVFLNTEQPPFNNSSIRRAFSAALDRELITSSLLVGDKPLRTPLPAKLSSTDQVVIDADCTEAKRLFEEGMLESGYTTDTFPKVTLSHFINVPGFTELAEYMQKLWSETFSIPVHLEGIEWNPFFAALQKGAFQIGGCSFDSHCHDPMEFFVRFESKDSFNFSQWMSQQFQEKLVQMRTASVAKRKLLFKEAEDILISEMPIIPICTHVHYYVHPKKWTGLKIDPSGCVDFSEVYFK